MSFTAAVTICFIIVCIMILLLTVKLCMLQSDFDNFKKESLDVMKDIDTDARSLIHRNNEIIRLIKEEKFIE